jgi:hypothetical protein
MSESLSKQMHGQTLARIVERLHLREVPEAGIKLSSHAPFAQGEIGAVQVYRGQGIGQLVTCAIVVPAIGLDSHMLFAFAESGSAVPHFTVDSVRNGADYAFHLDLIPRLDLAVELAYMDTVFAQLTPLLKAHREIAGLKPAQLDPRQYAVMSPWMLVNRANESAFRATFTTVGAYLDHWFTLLETGVSAAVAGSATASQLAARDDAHRAVLFNDEVDKVWKQITPLIGADAVTKTIALLRDTRA